MINRTSRSSTHSRDTAVKHPTRGGTQAGMTIRRLRLIALLGFLLLIVCSAAATFAALQTQYADALVINLAGRQRMLIQTMTLEVLGVQADADSLYREQLSKWI